VVPVTPGGLGVIDSTAPLLLVSFGVTRSVATLGVLAWRLVNFWLPIPAGAAAYVSLKVPRGAGLKAARRAVAEMMSRSDGREDKQEDPSEQAGAGAGSAPAGPADGGLVQQQPHGRDHPNRDQRAGNPQQHAAGRDRP
jgi:hypothetical protein